MHVRYRKQKQATKTKARSDTGKQEQANNTDIGYGQTRHEQRGAAARAAATKEIMGKQEQANNTDIGYGQTRHEQRGAAARAAAIWQPQLQFKFIGNADHGGMIIGRRDGL